MLGPNRPKCLASFSGRGQSVLCSQMGLTVGPQRVLGGVQ